MTHASFEAYCRERWGHGRRWADRNIAATEAVKELGPRGLTFESEKEARDVAPHAEEAKERTAAGHLRVCATRRSDRSLHVGGRWWMLRGSRMSSLGGRCASWWAASSVRGSELSS